MVMVVPVVSMPPEPPEEKEQRHHTNPTPDPSKPRPPTAFPLVRRRNDYPVVVAAALADEFVNGILSILALTPGNLLIAIGRVALLRIHADATKVQFATPGTLDGPACGDDAAVVVVGRLADGRISDACVGVVGVGIF